MAETLSWGRNLGCDFVFNSCRSWLLNQITKYVGYITLIVFYSNYILASLACIMLTMQPHTVCRSENICVLWEVENMKEKWKYEKYIKNLIVWKNFSI